MIYWQMRLDKKFSREKAAFWILFLVMAIYYGWRLFALTPWYDELYTYYCFISKGPFYAAIHWPLPNNHVGYSVLSAILDLFGNSYIGLRGVSYLCALANLYLVYRISSRWMKGMMPFVAVVLYLSMNLVNQMAVQGRGYTLGITCFLVSFLCMDRIVMEENCPKRYYWIYVFSLVLGLYTVSSNVYWVVPLCISGGGYLLWLSAGESRSDHKPIFQTDSWKKLLKLVAVSAIAALLTLFLYGTIWLAIGSNLLVKDETGIYAGLSHVQMIRKNPFAAVKRGMEYMLDTPYIQSEERAGFPARLGEFFLVLSGYYFGFLSLAVAAVWVIGLIALFWQVISGMRDKKEEGIFLELFLLLEILFVPVCLLIQCKRPYYRVFTYGGVVLSLLITWLAYGAIKKSGPKKKMVSIVFGLAVVALSVKCMFFSGYGNQYGERETEIKTVLSHGDIQAGKTYSVTDCNQEYLLFFLYGIRCENKEIEGSDMVMLDKRMMDPDFDEMVWEFYHYYDSIPWDYINEKMNVAYESENYVLYQK